MLSLLARWKWADGGSFVRWEKAREVVQFQLRKEERMHVCHYSVCVCVCVCPEEVKVKWERQCFVSEEYSYHCRWTLQLISPGHTGTHCVCFVCVCVCVCVYVCVCGKICSCEFVKYLLWDCEVCQDLYLHQRDASSSHTQPCFVSSPWIMLMGSHICLLYLQTRKDGEQTVCVCGRICFFVFKRVFRIKPSTSLIEYANVYIGL